MLDKYLYRPKLSNGSLVALTWPLEMYRCLNIICWPLAENVSLRIQIIYGFYWLIGLLIFVIHNDGEFRYLRWTHNELDNLLTGIPTFLALVEATIRILPLTLRKHTFREFLKQFYAEIYLHEKLEINSKVLKSIQRKFWPTYIIAFMYVITLLAFALKAVWHMRLGQHEMLYKMILPFDISSPWVFIPMILSNIWMGAIVVSHLVGETTILAQVVLHLSGRYQLMRDDLHNNIKGLLMTSSVELGNYNHELAGKAYRVIVKTINDSIRLKQFSDSIQKQFSFSIFLMMSFSAITLCALGFKVYTNPVDNVYYIFWILAKIVEMLVFGEIGSVIMITTDRISCMFYESEWELVLLHSTNVEENLHLLKTIYLAMTINHKPLRLSGMNFFNLSMAAMVKILQGAGSYFTCLISFR